MPFKIHTPKQSGQEHASSAEHVPSRLAPLHVLTSSLQEGLLSQSAQRQPSVNESHLPSSSQLRFFTSEQYPSLAQSAQMHESKSWSQTPSAVHRSGMHIAVGVQSFATILTRAYAGRMVDRAGAKATLVRGLLVSAGAGLVYLASVPFAPTASLAVLLAGRLVLGAGESLLITGVLSWAVIRAGATRAARPVTLFPFRKSIDPGGTRPPAARAKITRAPCRPAGPARQHRLKTENSLWLMDA